MTASPVSPPGVMIVDVPVPVARRLIASAAGVAVHGNRIGRVINRNSIVSRTAVDNERIGVGGDGNGVGTRAAVDVGAGDGAGIGDGECIAVGAEIDSEVIEAGVGDSRSDHSQAGDMRGSEGADAVGGGVAGVIDGGTIIDAAGEGDGALDAAGHAAGFRGSQRADVIDRGPAELGINIGSSAGGLDVDAVCAAAGVDGQETGVVNDVVSVVVVAAVDGCGSGGVSGGDGEGVAIEHGAEVDGEGVESAIRDGAQADGGERGGVQRHRAVGAAAAVVDSEAIRAGADKGERPGQIIPARRRYSEPWTQP